MLTEWTFHKMSEKSDVTVTATVSEHERSPRRVFSPFPHAVDRSRKYGIRMALRSVIPILWVESVGVSVRQGQGSGQTGRSRGVCPVVAGLSFVRRVMVLDGIGRTEGMLERLDPL